MNKKTDIGQDVRPSSRFGDPKRIRTADCAVRGRRLNHLTMGPICFARVYYRKGKANSSTLLLSVKVDEASLGDYLSLIVCQIAQSKADLLHSLIDDIGLDLLSLLFHSLLDIGNEYIVTDFEACVFSDNKRQHAPVDEIGSVSLGSIFIGDVSPAAKYLLAGSCLLTGRTVTGLNGIDGGTESRIVL